MLVRLLLSGGYRRDLPRVQVQDWIRHFVGVGTLSAPASFVPLQVVQPGGTISIPQLLGMAVPPPAVLPPGPYVFFAALASPGAFSDDNIGPGDILAIAVKTVTILP